MFSYCVHELRLSEDAAYKRIQAGRVARQFPAIFAAVADGRLHLSAVVLLAPYLTLENADGLLAAAAHRSKSEIEELLARRFPRSETMGLVQALPASAPQIDQPLAPGRVEAPGPMWGDHEAAAGDRGAGGGGGASGRGAAQSRRRNAAPGGSTGRRRGSNRAAPPARLPRRGSPARGRALRGPPPCLARAARAPSALLLPSAAPDGGAGRDRPGKRAVRCGSRRGQAPEPREPQSHVVAIRGIRSSVAVSNHVVRPHSSSYGRSFPSTTGAVLIVRGTSGRRAGLKIP